MKVYSKAGMVFDVPFVNGETPYTNHGYRCPKCMHPVGQLSDGTVQGCVRCGTNDSFASAVVVGEPNLRGVRMASLDDVLAILVEIRDQLVWQKDNALQARTRAKTNAKKELEAYEAMNLRLLASARKQNLEAAQQVHAEHVAMYHTQRNQEVAS